MTTRFAPLLVGVLVILALHAWGGAAAEDPTVVVFYLEDCEDCHRMMPVLKELEAQYPSLGFRFIEGADPDAPLMWSLGVKFGIMPSKFPVIFVGEKAIQGSSLADQLLLRSAVAACASSGCPSPLASLRAPTFPWMTILLVGLAALVVAVIVLA